MIEEYLDGQEPHYIVTRVVQGFSVPGFGAGAEITHWNGIPIDRAVELNANRFAGQQSCCASGSRRADNDDPTVADSSATGRAVGNGELLGTDGTARELRESWLVGDNLPTFGLDADTLTVAASVIGLDLGADEVGRAKRMLFAPGTIEQERAIRATGEPPPATDAADEPTSMPDPSGLARWLPPPGTFSHIRIFTFNVEDPDAFVAEFVRLVKLLPQTGLVVDVRGNGGGHILPANSPYRH